MLIVEFTMLPPRTSHCTPFWHQTAMFDLAQDKTSQTLARAFAESGKVVA